MDVKAAIELIRSMRKDVTSTGLSTTSNVNYYNLEPQAKTVYPVLFPLLASIPRTNPMQRGVRVGGTAVNWKAIVGISNGGYPGLSEGNRNAPMTFTERDYSSSFKYLGEDAYVTYQAEFAGLGFEDNLALCMSSTLNQELNDEEKMLLFGNSGTAGNGFQLGTAATPTVAAPSAGGSITSGTTLSVAVMALTGWGVTLATSTAAQLPFVRTSMNGAQDLINGGTSAMSAIGTSGSATSGSNLQVAATTTAKRGAMGYAWYIGTSASLSALHFYGVSSGPSITFTSLPSGTNQAANASTSAGAFTTDNSANALDFDGLTTWCFGQGGYWQDLGGAGLTANGDSTIVEWDAVQDYLWLNYKIPINKVWLGGSLINPVTRKILGSGVANNVTRTIIQDRGQVVGGDIATGYLIKYGPNAGKQAPIETHPWLPQGVIYFDLINNPYPAAANSIPTVRRVVTLEDHFGVKWPDVTLQKQYGVYTFQTIENYVPFGSAILTGVGLT